MKTKHGLRRASTPVWGIVVACASAMILAPEFSCVGDKVPDDTNGSGDDSAGCVGELEGTACSDEEKWLCECDTCGDAVCCGVANDSLEWLHVAVSRSCIKENGTIYDDCLPE